MAANMSRRGDFTFETDCVSCGDGQAIQAMVEAERQVTYRTMRKHCPDLDNWATQRGYELDPRQGLHLKNDWHVSYHRSVWKGRPCYYIRHSAIEHIFTRKGDRREAESEAEEAAA